MIKATGQCCDGSTAAGFTQPSGMGGSWRRGSKELGSVGQAFPSTHPIEDPIRSSPPATGQAQEGWLSEAVPGGAQALSHVTIKTCHLVMSDAGRCGSEGHTWVWECEVQDLWLGGPMIWLLGSFHPLFLPPSCCPLTGRGASILSRGWGLLPGSPCGSGTQPRAATVSLTLTGPCEQNRAGPRGSVHTAGLGFESWLCHLATV